MKRIIIPLSLAATLAAPSAILADESEGRRLAELAFSSVDSAERGYIDMGEFTRFGNDVFASMDADESGKVSLEEYMGWDYGMLPVAEERDRVDAYETALRIVFAYRDRNAMAGSAKRNTVSR
jgi:hypothetical protein